MPHPSLKEALQEARNLLVDLRALCPFLAPLPFNKVRIIIFVSWGSDREIHTPPPQNRDQHRENKIGGGAYFVFFFGSDNSHTTPQKSPLDDEVLLWAWCVVGGPLSWGSDKSHMEMACGGPLTRAERAEIARVSAIDECEF